jgi:hypothetical protein
MVRGTVLDKDTHLPVTGATIRFMEAARKTITSKDGLFSEILQAGKEIILVDHLEYKNKTLSILIHKDTVFDIMLEPVFTRRMIEEVTIIGKMNPRQLEPRAGIEYINLSKAAKILSIGGNRDAIKSLTLLPGVAPVSENSSEIQVRGGTHDQNLILLDGANLFHSTNFYGMISPFDPKIMERFQLFKGSFPAKFGGRLSSVADIGIRDGNRDSLRIESTLSFLSGRIIAEGPIIKEKASLLFSASRTLPDLLNYLAPSLGTNLDGRYFNVLAKASGIIDSSNIISLTVFNDQDRYQEKLSFDDLSGYSLIMESTSNSMISGSWKHLNNRSENQLSFHYSGYGLKYRIAVEDEHSEIEQAFDSHSSIREFKIEERIKGKLNKITYDGGFFGLIDRQLPLTIETSFAGKQTGMDTSGVARNNATLGGYLDLGWSDAKHWSFTGGTRIAHYFLQPGSAWSVEPRVNVQFKINNRHSLKAGYSRMSQPVHRLGNPGLGRPVNLWILASGKLPPQSADHYSLSYALDGTFLNQSWGCNIELYYKTMNHLVEFLDGYGPYHLILGSIKDPEGILTTGSGNSKGLELLIEKKSGRFTGWISYTLSQTRLQFDQLNKGNPYPSNNDQPHLLNLVLNYNHNKKWDFFLDWSFATGRPFTVAQYLVDSHSWMTISGSYTWPLDQVEGFVPLGNSILNIPGERNAYRMKSFHRLNVGVQFPIHIKKLNGSLEIGVYNLYNRKNPYYYYISKQTSSNGDDTMLRQVIKSVSVFPIMPLFQLEIAF